MAEQLRKAIGALIDSKEELEVLNSEEAGELEGGLAADNKCKNGFTVNCTSAFSMS